MFMDFREGYTLEMVNEKLCNLISKYKVSGDEPNRIKYDDMIFQIIYQYKYSDNLYSGNTRLDIEVPSDQFDEEQELMVPAVTGISVYVSPDSPDNDDIKKQLLGGYCFLDKVENEFLVFHIVKRKKFLYIVTLSYNEASTIRRIIDKRLEGFSERIKYIPARDSEVKMILDKLIAARIGEILAAS
jgi:hypothetical protein